MNVIGDPRTWEDDPNFPAITVSANTRLSATLSDDEEDANVHVFYQATDGSIKEIKYEASGNTWYEEGETVVTEAKPGTSLSVVGTAGELRLFYQTAQDLVKERYSDANIDWTEGKRAPNPRYCSHILKAFR